MKKITLLLVTLLSSTLFAQSEFDCINTNPVAYELYMECMEGDTTACELLSVLDCEEDTVTPEPETYFSWDCIYNYPEASELYSDFGNPESSAELEEFCLAVADGDWMWGDDPTEWPITCEEGTSIVTVEFETSGIGYQEEISWSLENYDGLVGLTPVCIEDGCTQFNMFDSWGDGWNGITFTINSPDGVLLTGTLDNGFVQSLPLGINTSELCFDVEEVENPDAFTCFEDVFPGIGNLDFDEMYPNETMDEESLFFVIEATEFDFSILDESGLELTPEEIDGFLIFGPISIDDLLTFIMNGDMGDTGIAWGFFRPMADETVSQGTLNKDNQNLPDVFSMESMSVNDVNNELIVYSTKYIDLMGKQVNNITYPGMFIKINNTNQGTLYNKIYIQQK